MIATTLTSECAAPEGNRICIVCGKPLTGGEQVRTGSVRLFRCAECETWSSYPRTDASLQTSIHDSGDYFAHLYFKGRREVTQRLQARCSEVFERLSCAIDTHSLRGERLLDVGCDTGTFLKCAAGRFGIFRVGLDVAARAARPSAVHDSATDALKGSEAGPSR